MADAVRVQAERAKEETQFKAGAGADGDLSLQPGDEDAQRDQRQQ
jgi:hypothetical protein